MAVMLCFGHFCEMHGPTSILCTQSLPSPAVAHEVSGSTGDQTKKTCSSCQLVLPKNQTGSTPSCLKTLSGNKKLCYLSARYPTSQPRFAAVRQASLRSLSSEHVFNDSTPMMLSDSKIGTAIIVVFNVEDGSSRGHVRKYSIICLGENEGQLAHAWSTVAPQMVELAKSIKLRAMVESQKEDAKRTGNERFLRVRERTQPRSLASILKDDKIFVEIHAKFAKMLSLL